MAEMRAERKTIFDYLSKNKFLIPMYQRNYVWSEDECLQLWEDVCNFFENKKEDEEYFLGCVVVYKENYRQNIIDGQQRTTTLNLLIRALYEKARGQNGIDKLKSDLAACLWDSNALTGQIDFDKVHLKSEVATDFDNQSLENLFKDTLDIKSNIKLSLYEKNFLFFQGKIDELAREKPVEWFDFCLCLLRSCVLLPIECDNRDKALRIFNTLNNRGVTLSPADIFKGLIFEKKNEEEKKIFAREWKELESKIQSSSHLKKEDISFLFTQYEHIIRAEYNDVDTAIPSTLDFWTQKHKKNTKGRDVNYAANDDMLSKESTFIFIQKLGDFWCNPYEYLSQDSKKYFALLGIYQNKLWQMVVSMCFYKHHQNKEALQEVLDIILPQVAAYCAIGLLYGKGGASGLLWGFMKANIHIYNNNIQKIFETSKNIPNLVMPSLESFIHFSKKALPRHIRYILALYALMLDSKQELEWNLNGKNYTLMSAEIEHILPRKWLEANYNGWDKKDAQEFLEHIGNKMLLEKKVNIEAGNGYFHRKKESYKNSHFKEAQLLAQNEQKDWAKTDIEKRNRHIYEKFRDLFTRVF